LFAVGVVLISIQFKNSPFDIENILFGEINYLPYSDGWWMYGLKIPYITVILFILVIINLFFLIRYKKLWLIISFDQQMAKIQGVKVLKSTLFFLSLITINTVVSFQSVGAIMMISLTVVPVSCAYVLTKKLNWFFGLTLVISVISVLVGYFLAYLFDLNIIAMISVLLGFSLFLVLFVQSIQKKTKNKLQKSL
jgi:manganese/zinc/iron transport system permease protein